MKNEKAIISAKDYGSNTDLTNRPTQTNSKEKRFVMDNNTPTQNNFQFNSRRELLDATKLSRLPERTPFRLPDFDNAPVKTVAVVAVCAGCNTRLDTDDKLQLKFSGCRKCFSVYGRLDAAREENAKRETRELLEKFAAKVKQR